MRTTLSAILHATWILVFMFLAFGVVVEAWTASGTGSQGPTYKRDLTQDVKMECALTSDGFDSSATSVSNHVHASIENWGKEPTPNAVTLGYLTDSMDISAQWDNDGGDSATFHFDWTFDPDSSGSSRVLRASFSGSYDIAVTQYVVTLDGITWYDGSGSNPSHGEYLVDTDTMPHFVAPTQKLSDFMSASERAVSMSSADCCLKVDATLEYLGTWCGLNGPYHPETGTYHEVYGSGPGQGRALVEALFDVSLTKQ